MWAPFSGAQPYLQHYSKTCYDPNVSTPHNIVQWEKRYLNLPNPNHQTLAVRPVYSAKADVQTNNFEMDALQARLNEGLGRENPSMLRVSAYSDTYIDGKQFYFRGSPVSNELLLPSISMGLNGFRAQS